LTYTIHYRYKGEPKFKLEPKENVMKLQAIFNRLTPVTAVVFTALVLGNTVRADVITSDPSLPVLSPPGYYTNGFAHVNYAGGGVTIILTNVGHQALGPVVRNPSGPDEIETFNSLFTGQGSVLGLGPLSFSGNGSVMTIVHNKIGNTTGTFNTEMLSMNLSGNTPFGPLMIRESPTLPSLGVTTITGLGGGLFQISSFFDVFTELSLDGGQTWIPDSGGPERMTLVPEPSVCALVGLAAGLLTLKRTRWFRRR
jgi:hypothetical protein